MTRVCTHKHALPSISIETDGNFTYRSIRTVYNPKNNYNKNMAMQWIQLKSIKILRWGKEWTTGSAEPCSWVPCKLVELVRFLFLFVLFSMWPMWLWREILLKSVNRHCLSSAGCCTSLVGVIYRRYRSKLIELLLNRSASLIGSQIG